jgi:hypothetical protein
MLDCMNTSTPKNTRSWTNGSNGRRPAACQTNCRGETPLFTSCLLRMVPVGKNIPTQTPAACSRTVRRRDSL